MSVCRNCGEEIDWVRTPKGRYIPVDMEPVLVIEGEGTGRFYDEELGELTGRLAKPEEVQTKKQKINALAAYIPHWRTCGKGR